MGGKPLKWSIDQVDINLLRTFCTIVASGGFSNAQARLNVSAAAISMKMTKPLKAVSACAYVNEGRPASDLATMERKFTDTLVVFSKHMTNFLLALAT